MHFLPTEFLKFARRNIYSTVTSHKLSLFLAGPNIVFFSGRGRGLSHSGIVFGQASRPCVTLDEGLSSAKLHYHSNTPGGACDVQKIEVGRDLGPVFQSSRFGSLRISEILLDIWASKPNLYENKPGPFVQLQVSQFERFDGESVSHSGILNCQESFGLTPFTPNFKKYILPTFYRELYKWWIENLLVQSFFIWVSYEKPSSSCYVM